MATKKLSERLADAKAEIEAMPDNHDGIDLKHHKRTATIQLDQAINSTRALEKLTK